MNKANKANKAVKARARNGTGIVRLGAGLTMSIEDDIRGVRPTLTKLPCSAGIAGISAIAAIPAGASLSARSPFPSKPLPADKPALPGEAGEKKNAEVLPFALMTPQAPMLDVLRNVADARVDREKAGAARKEKEAREGERTSAARAAYESSLAQSLAEKSAQMKELPSKLKAIEEEAEARRLEDEAANFEALRKWKAEVASAKSAQKASLESADETDPTALREEISRLEGKLEEEKRRADHWERRCEELRNRASADRSTEAAGGMSSAQQKFLSLLIDPEYSPTPVECLEILESCGSPNIVILPSAWQSAAASSDFLPGRRLLSLLYRLATAGMEAFLAGKPVDAACAFSPAEYAASERVQTIMSPGAAKARTFEWKGKAYLMQKHLRIGKAEDRRRTIRVHFEWDGERKCLVIGWCGAHLPV